MASEARHVWAPDIPVAPGETIREILEDRAISQADFATRLGKSEKFVSQLVNGKASLTYETAIELERVLGVPAAFWNSAEATFRGLLTRQRRAAASKEHAEWTRSFPLKEMAERGWIAREAGVGEQAEELLSFFGVSSVEAYRDYWSSGRRLAARMSTAYTAETPALAAWLRAGERAAELIPTGRFDEPAFRGLLSELRAATLRSPAEWIPLLVERCATVGVAVVFVPDMPKTRCHAVSWWVSRTRAVIQLGLRGKTDDQVWFSFFHEAAHLLLDDSRRAGISDLNDDPVAEARANEFAGDHLIPRSDYEQFISRVRRPSRAEVAEFAAAIGIALSILVGRLQRDKVIPYDWMNDAKTRIDWA